MGYLCTHRLGPVEPCGHRVLRPVVHWLVIEAEYDELVRAVLGGNGTP